ncbi:MAG: TolC family protein [Chitinophagaceae bacterium]|nr:TolC family protein [Chitinophagaceae bacterium]
MRKLISQYILMQCILFVFLCFISDNSIAQKSGITDTISISLQQAETRFLDSNFLLLAAHYNVNAQNALIEQARTWDNPTLNLDKVIAANGQFLPHGKNPDGSYNGQYFIQIQQLIKTAGKRGKLVNMAGTNARLSELQLQDVVRNLKYQLRTDYYTILQQIEQQKIYEGQLGQLKKLLTGMEAQLNAGNIAQKDYLRIQALLIALEQDITELNKSIADNQNDLKTLLQIRENVFIKPSENFNKMTPISNIVSNEILFDTGKLYNPYYRLQQIQTLYQQQNLSYQKALRVPDLTLGPNFDRNSNYVPNYAGLGISLPLPILNSNKGNIKSAEYSVKQQQAFTSNAETELKNNISNAYNKLLLTLKQYNSTQKEFYEKYQLMYNNVLQSYQQKQISLLEFLDFFNDYTDSQIRHVQQQLNLQLSKEELNFQTGIDILK